MARLFANFCELILAEPLTAIATSMEVEDTDRLPAVGGGDYCVLTLDNGTNDPELVKVTAASGTVLTIERAQEDTGASAWEAGTSATLGLTAGAVEPISGALAAVNNLSDLDDAAEARENLGAGPRRAYEGVEVLTASHTLDEDDIGKLLLINDDAAVCTITIPPASEYAEGATFFVKKIGQHKELEFVVSDLEGDDVLSYDRSSHVIAELQNGDSGRLRLKMSTENRDFVDDEWIRITGLTGGQAVWNGLHKILRVKVEALALQHIELVDSVYSSGTVAAAGTPKATLVMRTMTIYAQGGQVALTAYPSDNRWLLESPSAPEAYGRRDWIWNKMTPYTKLRYDGVGSTGGSAATLFDGAFGPGFRLQTRSAKLAEFWDPAEVMLERHNGQDGYGVYPDGPLVRQVLDTETVGLIHASATGPDVNGVVVGRCGVIGFKALGDQTTLNRGGEIRISTPLSGTAAVLDKVYIGDNISWGARNGNGRFELYYDGTSLRAFVFQQTEAGAGTTDMMLFSDLRAAATTWDFLEMTAAGAPIYRFRGDGNLQIDGSVTTPAADVAEYFREWHDGNKEGEDRAGMSVVLVRRDDPDRMVHPSEEDYDDTFIRKASDFVELPGWDASAIIGVVSPAPAMKGGGGETHWPAKYLKDDLGRFVLAPASWVSWTEADFRLEGKSKDGILDWVVSERRQSHFLNEPGFDQSTIPAESSETLDDVRRRMIQQNTREPFTWCGNVTRGEMEGCRVLNPDFDPGAEWTPREDRLEWDYIGFIGQIAMLDSQPRRKEWRKIKKITDGVSLWFIFP